MTGRKDSPPASLEGATPQYNRSIDDFLDELYDEYERRWLAGNQDRPGGPFQKCVGLGGYLPVPLLSLCIANSSDATEILMLSYLLADPGFRGDMLAQDEDGQLQGAGYLAASVFLGMLLGGTLLGFLSDSCGRRPALLFGLITNSVAGMLSSLPLVTPSVRQLTFWRFVAGIGIGATVPPLFALVSEWSPKKVRGGMVTAVASFWMVGSLFVAGAGWCFFRATGDPPQPLSSIWRLFAALCAFPSGLGAFMVYCHVPESPRFLASVRNDYEQSAHACNRMAHLLGCPTLPTTHQGHNLEQIHQNRDFIQEMTNLQTSELYSITPLTNQELQCAHHVPSSSSTTQILNHSDNGDAVRNFSMNLQALIRRSILTLVTTLRQLYSPPLLPTTTLPLQIIWFSLSFGTYGISTWINTLFVAVHLQDMYLNSFLFALANLPGNIVSALYSDKWGRKGLLIGSLLGGALSLAGFALFVYAGDDHRNRNLEQKDIDQLKTRTSSLQTCAIVFSACTFQMFSIVSWNAIDILTGELFPTRVRSAGMGVCTASGRMGAMVAQLVNGRLMAAGSQNTDSEGTIASAWILVVAATTLLIGAAMPLLLEQDMAGGELKDEVSSAYLHSGQTSQRIFGPKGRKDHLSDDEHEFSRTKSTTSPMVNNGANKSDFHQYQSFRDEIESNEPFLL